MSHWGRGCTTTGSTVPFIVIAHKIIHAHIPCKKHSFNNWYGLLPLATDTMNLIVHHNKPANVYTWYYSTVHSKSTPCTALHACKLWTRVAYHLIPRPSSAALKRSGSLGMRLSGLWLNCPKVKIDYKIILSSTTLLKFVFKISPVFVG